MHELREKVAAFDSVTELRKVKERELENCTYELRNKILEDIFQREDLKRHMLDVLRDEDLLNKDRRDFEILIGGPEASPRRDDSRMSVST